MALRIMPELADDAPTPFDRPGLMSWTTARRPNLPEGKTMTEPSDFRTSAKRLVDDLPDGAGWEELIQAICLQQADEAARSRGEYLSSVDRAAALAKMRARINCW